MAKYRDQVRASTKLRECPFCSYPAKLDSTLGWIKCMGCGTTMEVGIGPARGEVDTIEKLVKAWNSRDRQSAMATVMGIPELARTKKWQQ